MKSIEVAKHVIDYCLSINGPVSFLQTKCIVFLLDRYHIINHGSRLVDEVFKWDNSVPYTDDVEGAYRMFASNPINIYQELEQHFDERVKGELYGFIDKTAKMYPSILVEKCAREKFKKCKID